MRLINEKILSKAFKKAKINVNLLLHGEVKVADKHFPVKLNSGTRVYFQVSVTNRAQIKRDKADITTVVEVLQYSKKNLHNPEPILGYAKEEFLSFINIEDLKTAAKHSEEEISALLLLKESKNWHFR